MLLIVLNVNLTIIPASGEGTKKLQRLDIMTEVEMVPSSRLPNTVYNLGTQCLTDVVAVQHTTG